MPPPLILDPASVDLSKPIMDIEAIRKVNPQRFEMEQLTAIIRLDSDTKVMIAYKDVRADEFWVRGHMPDFPLMPGVLMCEAAAQMSGLFLRLTGILGGDFIAFGGMENVRFRGTVKPGDRLVLIGKLIRLNRRGTTSHVQGFVNNVMVFQGDFIGVPFTRGAAAAGAEDS